MSASAPTMKTFHKRLYTVLPRGVSQAASASTSTSVNGRLRSNSSSSTSSRSFYTASSSSSLSAFFADGPPPTPSPARPQLSSTRLPIEAKGQVEGPPSPTHHHHHHNGHQSSQSSTSSHGPAPPSSIALTSPPANGSSPFGGLPPSAGPFFPYTPFNPPPVPSPAPSAPLDAHAHHQATSKRPGRHRYHFDVGAYGIPKRSRTVVSGRDGRGSHHSSASRWTAPSPITDALDLAVQVGEDAYFVRENAMGVADGVGGWSRALAPTLGPSDPSPSALFARRLMHFCSAEVASLSSAPTPSSSNVNTSATFAFHEPTSPQPPPYVPFFPGPGFTSWHEPYVPTYLAHPHHPHHARVDPLAAVVEEDDPDAAEMDELEEGLDVLLILERAYARALEAHVAPAPAAPPSRPPSPALFRAHQDREKEKKTESIPLMTGSSTALLAVLDSAGAGPHPHPAPEVSPPSSAAMPGTSTAATVEGCDAVLRIAHLGDCMGMLVRDEEIVWRSDEMWWSFNTPLQLGPASRTPPTSAQILTLPVRADDILILASDGLSDNLWDEDVLDEVVRFRRARNLSSTTTSSSSDQSESQGGRAGGAAAAKPSALGRRTLAGMLSEALCSRARMVSERRTTSSSSSRSDSPSDEVPFARRAREEGRSFAGGKADDISVLVAVISPAEESASAGVV